MAYSDNHITIVWAFQRFQPPPLILRKNEGIMSLPCSAIN